MVSGRYLRGVFDGAWTKSMPVLARAFSNRCADAGQVAMASRQAMVRSGFIDSPV